MSLKEYDARLPSNQNNGEAYYDNVKANISNGGPMQWVAENKSFPDLFAVRTYANCEKPYVST